MVKQFSIPCQFGNETSPVTLYIGHPENEHHPLHWQSDWLSSVKGGTIPQDLMDTLQRLHDLAMQNGADFEELCYYALISATQHGTGNGVSQDDINKYADEYVKKEGNVKTENNENAETNNNVSNDGGEEKYNSNNVENSNNGSNSEDNQMGQAFDEIKKQMSPEDTKNAEAVFNELGNKFVSEDNSTNDNTPSGNNSFNNSTDNTSSDSGNSFTYSQEDEDLLFADDVVSVDNYSANDSVNSVDGNNNATDDNNVVVNKNNIEENVNKEDVVVEQTAYSQEDEDLL